MLFFLLLPTDSEKEICTVQELEEKKIYSRGNHKDFTTFLQKQTNQDNPKVSSIGGRPDLLANWVLG